MNDKDKIEVLELKIKLLETQLELERLKQPERVVYPEVAPIQPWYPTYPFNDIWWTYTTSDKTTS